MFTCRCSMCKRFPLLKTLTSSKDGLSGKELFHSHAVSYIGWKGWSPTRLFLKEPQRSSWTLCSSLNSWSVARWNWPMLGTEGWNLSMLGCSFPLRTCPPKCKAHHKHKRISLLLGCRFRCTLRRQKGLRYREVESWFWWFFYEKKPKCNQ